MTSSVGLCHPLHVGALCWLMAEGFYVGVCVCVLWCLWFPLSLQVLCMCAWYMYTHVRVRVRVYGVYVNVLSTADSCNSINVDSKQSVHGCQTLHYCHHAGTSLICICLYYTLDNGLLYLWISIISVCVCMHMCVCHVG